MWFMERVEVSESRTYMVVYRVNGVNYGGSSIYKEKRLYWYIKIIMWIMDQVECTERKIYSGI